jgi:hypothetical protein
MHRFGPNVIGPRVKPQQDRSLDHRRAVRAPRGRAAGRAMLVPVMTRLARLGRISLRDRHGIMTMLCRSVIAARKQNQTGGHKGERQQQDHLEDQFDAYLRKEREKGHHPLAFLVIAPSFTPQSIKLAHQYKARTNWDIALVEAAALKYLADQWNATEPDKPFPVRLLNRTELIDKDKVEFLLSLA